MLGLSLVFLGLSSARWALTYVTQAAKVRMAVSIHRIFRVNVQSRVELLFSCLFRIIHMLSSVRTVISYSVLISSSNPPRLESRSPLAWRKSNGENDNKLRPECPIQNKTEARAAFRRLTTYIHNFVVDWWQTGGNYRLEAWSTKERRDQRFWLLFLFGGSLVEWLRGVRVMKLTQLFCFLGFVTFSEKATVIDRVLVPLVLGTGRTDCYWFFLLFAFLSCFSSCLCFCPVPFLGCYDSTGSEPKKGRTPWGPDPFGYRP